MIKIKFNHILSNINKNLYTVVKFHFMLIIIIRKQKSKKENENIKNNLCIQKYIKMVIYIKDSIIIMSTRFKTIRFTFTEKQEQNVKHYSKYSNSKTCS